MKKGIIITVISLLSVLLIAFISIILPRIIRIGNEREYAPYNYPGSVWICEEPEIEYSIPTDAGESIAATEIEGKELYFFFGTNNSHVDAVRYNDDHTISDSDLLFSGTISYSKDEFTITIDKDSDRLFNGEYDSLVFHRVESETN